MSVVIETSVGDITIDLYVEERPKSCLNFLKLCKMKAFHFNLFHFVQRNFVIQTGDPTGTGRGGESIFKHIYGEQVYTFYFFKHARTAANCPYFKHSVVNLLVVISISFKGFAQKMVCL